VSQLPVADYPVILTTDVIIFDDINHPDRKKDAK